MNIHCFIKPKFYHKKLELTFSDEDGKIIKKCCHLFDKEIKSVDGVPDADDLIIEFIDGTFSAFIINTLTSSRCFKFAFYGHVKRGHYLGPLLFGISDDGIVYSLPSYKRYGGIQMIRDPYFEGKIIEHAILFDFTIPIFIGKDKKVYNQFGNSCGNQFY